MTLRQTPLLLLLSACGWRGPDCADVDLGTVAVDVSGAAPVVSWDGEGTNSLEVYAGEVVPNGQPYDDFDPPGQPVWQLDCLCVFQVEDPGSNRGCGNSDEEIAFRACLESPVEYGVVPEPTIGAVEESVAPVALVAGELYTAALLTFCTGELLQDDDYNGGDPYRPHQARAYASFVAPD